MSDPHARMRRAATPTARRARLQRPADHFSDAGRRTPRRLWRSARPRIIDTPLFCIVEECISQRFVADAIASTTGTRPPAARAPPAHDPRGVATVITAPNGTILSLPTAHSEQSILSRLVSSNSPGSRSATRATMSAHRKRDSPVNSLERGAEQSACRLSCVCCRSRSCIFEVRSPEVD